MEIVTVTAEDVKRLGDGIKDPSVFVCCILGVPPVDLLNFTRHCGFEEEIGPAKGDSVGENLLFLELLILHADLPAVIKQKMKKCLFLIDRGVIRRIGVGEITKDVGVMLLFHLEMRHRYCSKGGTSAWETC